MKVLGVLVLVFLTACDGGHHEHPSQNKVDLVEQAYWKYVQDTTKTSKDHLWQIRHSSSGQHLCFLISKSIDIIYTFFRLLYAHLVVWTSNLYHIICHEIDHLHQHLDDFLCDLEADIDHHGKELAAKIRWKFEDIKHCAAHHIEGLDPKGLKIALQEKTHELHEYLDNCFEHLHTHHHHHGHHHHHHGHKHPGHHQHHHGHHHHHHGHKHPGHHQHHHGHHHHHHGHKHPGHHHHGRHHHGHGHKHPGHHHHGHHHHGHKHPGHHHHGHHHHHHGHKHPGHHHHKQEHDLKKELVEHIEAFKKSCFSLVHNFDVKVTHTTEELNKKHAPHGRKCHRKPDKTSNDHKEYLECLWHDWISYYDKKAH